MNDGVLKTAIKGAQKVRKIGRHAITVQEALTQGLELVDNANVCILGTNSDAGYPNIKALLNLKHEGLKRFWFSTNTSSKRVGQLRKDNRACLYYMDEKLFKGLMLIGTVEILQDEEPRNMLWAEGAEVYYPLGVNDPDYSVLCFAAERGNYYQALQNVTFEIG